MNFSLPYLGEINLHPKLFKHSSPSMKSAEKYYQDGNYYFSIKVYKKILAQDINSKKIRNNLACCLLLVSDCQKAQNILKQLRDYSKICSFNLALAATKTGSFELGLSSLDQHKEKGKVLLLKAVIFQLLSDPIKSFEYIHKYQNSRRTEEINSILQQAKPKDFNMSINRGHAKHSKAVKNYIYKFLSKSSQNLTNLTETSAVEETQAAPSINEPIRKSGNFTNSMIYRNSKRILTRIMHPPESRVRDKSPIGQPGLNSKEVLISEKMLNFPEVKSLPVINFPGYKQLEKNIDLKKFSQISVESLLYLSKELNSVSKDIESLYNILKNLKFFKKHKPIITQKLIKVSIYENYPPGSVVLQEGEPGFHVYVIISGSVIITKKNCGKDIVIASAYDGDIIGEYAFIRKTKEFKVFTRTANCITTEETHLLRIKNSDITDIIEEFADLNNDNLLFIKALKPFQNITPLDLALLSNTMTVRQYELNECILKAGEVPDCLFFVYKGRVNVTYPARQMIYSKILRTVSHSIGTKELSFGVGNIFCQRVLMGLRVPANFPVYADSLSYTTLLFIYKEDFEQLFKPVQMEILRSLSKWPEFDLKIPEDFNVL